MRNAIILALIFCIIGLIVGYIMFAKVAGHYIGIDQLLGFKGNIIEDVFNKFAGINKIRMNVLILGAGGLILGLLIGALLKGKRR